MIEKHNVLVVADIDFKFKAIEKESFLTKLLEFLTKKNENSEIVITTVSGKYSYSEKYNAIEIDDKNKTSFVKTIGDNLSKFHEIVIISNYQHEPFLEALKGQLNEENKATSIFSYKVEDVYGSEKA